MKPPTFVRTLTAAERQQLQAGLRATEAFTVPTTAIDDLKALRHALKAVAT